MAIWRFLILFCITKLRGNDKLCVLFLRFKDSNYNLSNYLSQNYHRNRYIFQPRPLGVMFDKLILTNVWMMVFVELGRNPARIPREALSAPANPGI